MTKIFIDGAEGTTGLRIKERLENRKEFTLLTLLEEERKNITCREKMINQSDITVLCLPDAAAREAVGLAKGGVRLVDASTAHRTESGWAYGFPELDADLNQKIMTSKRVAVPGCHASGILAITYPLLKRGHLDKDAILTPTSLTGFSGGGKAMIKEYEDAQNAERLLAPRMYALSQQHKHIKEIVKISGLNNAPVFNPIVCNFYSGMLVSIPFNLGELSGFSGLNDVKDFFFEYYRGKRLITVTSQENDMISANKLCKKDNMEIIICGNDKNFTINAVYDNLGKGASGAAIQCINLMVGLNETEGLIF